jgi:hypothetical protein
LTASERTVVADLVELVLDEDPQLPLEHKLDRLAVYAYELPPRMRLMLTDFRLTGRPYGGFAISGLPLNEAAVGPTPLSYNEVIAGSQPDRAAAVLLLVGSLLGNPFSYLSQQRGRLVLDVYPVRGH